jgi:hypothetical protein
MQEATFESDKKDKADDADEEELDGLVNEFNSNVDFGVANQLDCDDDPGEPTTVKSTKKKSVSGKIILAGLKMGKAGLKVGKKVTKATVKTAKTVNTLASYKDHTDRIVPSAKPTEVQEGFPGWSSTDVLHYLFKEQLPTYERALSHQLGEMRLVVYYNPLKVNLNVLGVKYKATGMGGLANKGGIVAEVAINESTVLSFLTAHLEAHEGEEKYQTRCTSFMDILSSTRSSTTSIKLDAPLASHFTFCLGDLNFRTRIPGVEPGSERHIQIAHNITKAKDWVLLNKYDELASAVRNKECLAGFRTPYCNFDPTFKVARQDGYEYNPKRSPSFTDRILFKTGDQLAPAIKSILYEPIEHFTTSDHKPIRGGFTIRLNDRLQWRPAPPIHQKSNKTTKSSDNEGGFLGWNRSQHGNRETMHVLVSSIGVVIDPANYDKIRKVEKAGLPDSYLSFITTPGEAIQVDFSKRSLWRKLDLDSTSLSKPEGKRSKSPSNSKVSPKGFPRTCTVKDTMKPQWKGDYVHFAIRTHLTTGDPIDLTGALVHANLYDKREDKSIGTCSINLAQLIRATKNPSSISKVRIRRQTPSSDGQTGSNVAGRAGSSSVSPHVSLRKPLGETRPSPMRTDRPSPMRTDSGDIRPGRPGGRRVSLQVSPRKPSGETQSDPMRTISGDLRAGRSGGQGVSPQVSTRKLSGETRSDPIRGGPVELRLGRTSGRGFPPPLSNQEDIHSSPIRGSSNELRPAANQPSSSDARSGGRGRGPSRRTAVSPPKKGPLGSLKNVTLGASMSMQEILEAEDDAALGQAINKRLRDLKVTAVLLDEAMFEGGLEVARLKCQMDIWWVEDPILDQN